MFPFSIFEVEKKNGSSFTSRLLKFDFVERTVSELKEEKLTKGYNFSSIAGGVLGFKKEEFLLNVLESNDVFTNHYRARYVGQRDLIVQIILLAKDVFEKRHFHLVQHKNPNTEKFAMEKPKVVKHSDIKMISTDRILPAKSLKKVQVSRKSGFAEKRLFFILGLTQILVTKDENANEIINVYPIQADYNISLVKTKDSDTYTFQILEEKQTLKFNNAEDGQGLFESLNKILSGVIKKENTIISLPYLKKDLFVTKIKREKLKGINKKIEDLKKKLEALINSQKELEAEIEYEEMTNPYNQQKAREDNEMQEEDARQEMNLGVPKNESIKRLSMDFQDDANIRRGSKMIKEYYLGHEKKMI